jgi:deoxyribose-phosphate aldolase
MVINIGALKSGQNELVESDIKAVVDASGDKLVKVIIETCLLSYDEKVQACQLAKLAGADFVKTSTGFSTGGATIEDVELMREVVGPNMGVKAAGGTRSYKDAQAFIKAGANRIGTSAGLAVDPSAKVADISVGAQQRVEILKTLYRGADILIFDEPTAVLTPSEITELLNIMRTLVKEGKSIILITHKLDEIRAVSDRVTVIRRGKSIDTVTIEGSTNADLAEMMVGRHVSFKTAPTSIPKRIAIKGTAQFCVFLDICFLLIQLSTSHKDTKILLIGFNRI